MSADLAKHNIRVNAIAPGTVDTGLLDTWTDPVLKKNLQDRIDKCPYPRLITRDEIANLVMYLLSPLSTMIVGESVLIDGGFSTW